jgi:hypothetical protein
MKLLLGRQATNRKEAIDKVFQVTGVDGISEDIIDMFTSITSGDKINIEAEKIISSTIRNRYGVKSTWRVERWFIPIPTLHYEGKDTPRLIIEAKVYIVATADVKLPQSSHSITLIETVSKPETLAIPMVFLHALLEKDIGRFTVIARDASHTQWEVPGIRPVQLPNDFVGKLTVMLRWRSVVDWLLGFGSQGRCVAPLVAGSLLGLAFQESTPPVPVSNQEWTTDDLVNALESMAFRHGEAGEMVSRAASRLKAGITLEEAIRSTLQVQEIEQNHKSEREEINGS